MNKFKCVECGEEIDDDCDLCEDCALDYDEEETEEDDE